MDPGKIQEGITMSDLANPTQEQDYTIIKEPNREWVIILALFVISYIIFYIIGKLLG